MKKILYGLVLTFVAFSFQSCLHDEKDTFDESASTRISEAVTNDQKILESSTNGWLFHYYAGEDYSEGGYTFLVKFKGGKATVASEIANADTTITSDYAITKDQGPVLTFNTYNMIMHYFASASSGDVDGQQGDYEFIIMKATQDSIVLKGKKWKNKMVMTRMPETTKWSSYIDSVYTIDNAIKKATFKYVVNNDSLASFIFDNRLATITVGSNTYSRSYVVTSKGYQLDSAVTINKTSVQNLIWNSTTGSFSIPTSSSASLQFYRPANYHDITEYSGRYYLYFYDKALKLKKYPYTLTPNSDGDGLVAHSDSLAYNFKYDYSQARGTLSLVYQDLGNYKINGTTYDVRLCPWSIADGGYFTWSSGVGMDLKPVSGSNMLFKFVDNGKWSYAVDSFIFVTFSNGNYDSSGLSYTPRLRYTSYLQKINDN